MTGLRQVRLLRVITWLPRDGSFVSSAGLAGVSPACHHLASPARLLCVIIGLGPVTHDFGSENHQSWMAIQPAAAFTVAGIVLLVSV